MLSNVFGIFVLRSYIVRRLIFSMCKSSNFTAAGKSGSMSHIFLRHGDPFIMGKRPNLFVCSPELYRQHPT